MPLRLFRNFKRIKDKIQNTSQQPQTSPINNRKRPNQRREFSNARTRQSRQTWSRRSKNKSKKIRFVKSNNHAIPSLRKRNKFLQGKRFQRSRTALRTHRAM